MIGLDTNILVRFLVQDDREQAKRATQCIEEQTAHGEKLFLNTIVLCELVWVLESAYHLGKVALVDVLEKILLTTQFEIEYRDCVWRALTEYRNKNVDFSDCLIGKINSFLGCSVTFSFDRKAATLADFRKV